MGGGGGGGGGGFYCAPVMKIEFQRLYSGTPLNGHPSTVDTHDITDSSESPDCPSVHFNT